jgi:GR25 family glycosyltransferase involved in LPS biosynthesis
MAFLNPEVSSCLVLEDDIVVSDDILELADKLLKLHSKKRKFRGINFYSIDTNEKVSVCAFVKLNYSFGWGWLITRKTFNQINYWTGKEDAHWDYFIEPFIRTGYLVAPVHSRVKNIGFDHTATHTKEGSWIGNEMEKSFILAKMENSERLVEISGAKYQTIRKDCLSVSELTKLDTWKLFILRCVSYSFYRMAIRGSTQMHFIWRETRNRIDNHFSAK